MANNVLYLDPGEAYSVPASTLPASRVPPQPAASTLITVKPGNQKQTPGTGKKIVAGPTGTGGGQGIPHPSRVGVVKVKRRQGHWVFMPDGRMHYVQPGRSAPAHSHPIPQLLPAAPRPEHARGGILGFVEKHIVKPLEEGAPIVAPLAATAVVTAACPECTAIAALAAGGASFAAHRAIAHEDNAHAFIAAAADYLGVRLHPALERVLENEVGSLLAKQETSKAINLVTLALLADRNYATTDAFHHR